MTTSSPRVCERVFILAFYLLSVLDAVWCKGDGSGSGSKSHDNNPIESPTQSSTSQPSTTSSTTSSTPSTSNIASAIPTASFSFQFTAPNNTTTCDSTTFFWSSQNLSDMSLSLLVTNEMIPNLTQPSVLPINETIGTNISLAMQEFAWLSVDVSQGWYAVQASSPSTGVLNTSSPFFVDNGSNVSCLLGNSDTTTSNNSQVAPSPTDTPPSPNSSSLGIGPLIGTVLGSIAAVVVIIVAFRFPQFWRHGLPSPKPRRAILLY